MGINKNEIISFFNELAPNWDAGLVPCDNIIERILDNACIGANMSILDVACGTGVMFSHYLSRGASSVTGVDIAPEMAKIAADKYAQEQRVSVICADVELWHPEQRFDAAVVYNAFPHFPDAERLIQVLVGMLKPGGRLTIAHSMSREQINDHHKGRASYVSNGLMSIEELMDLAQKFIVVDVAVSDAEMYQLAGSVK